MRSIKKSILASIMTVVTTTALISAFYTIAIPTIAPTYKTYSILVGGIIISAIIGGYIGHQTYTNEKPFIRIGFGMCYALVIVVSVVLLSLFLILNVRGS